MYRTLHIVYDMDKGSESTTTTEIVCGLPVLVKARDNLKPVIRIKPKPVGGRRKKRVEHPTSISHKDRNDLTIKMRKALSNHFSGMPKKEAGIAAGYTPQSATTMLNRALTLAAGNAAFLEEMEKQNITNEKLIGILNDGLEATHPLSKDGNKDYRTIHSFWRDAVKMKDGFPAKRIHSESENKHVHIHITADDRQAIDKIERMRQEAIDASADPY